MKSTVGGGSPKSRQKEQNQLICDSDKKGRESKFEIVWDVKYGSTLTSKIVTSFPVPNNRVSMLGKRVSS